MALILGQGFLGAFLILVLGVLLALFCAGLPRLASLWEGPKTREGSLLREPAVAPSREAPVAAAPRAEAPATRAEAAAEESLVAAAIALALSLYETETAASSLEPPLPGGGASPWVTSGRWQAMQARHSRQKR